MTKRAAVQAIVIVAIAEIAVAMAIWWLATGTPFSGTARQVTAPAAIQRLAEMHADAASPSLAAGDHARLAALIQHSSQWPEIVYVSIENAQGRILAHTDPAHTGRVWSSRVATAIRGTVKTDYAEVVAPVVSLPGGDRSGTRLGHVRLGYVVDAVTGGGEDTPTPTVALWLVVLLAGLVSVPAGLLVAWVTSASSEEADVPADVHHPPVREEPRRERIHALVAETERLKKKLEERSRRLDERNRELDQQTLDLAEARSALGTRTAELEELHRAVATHREQLEVLRAENADWQAVVRRLHAELEERTAALSAQSAPASLQRAAPVGGANGHELSEEARQAVRQLTGGAIDHISHLLRGSLTNVLGFSKLLLRRSDGPLNEVQVASVTSIQDAGLRLLGVVNALSEYARAQAGTTEYRPERVDVGAVMRDVLAELDRSNDAPAVKLNGMAEAATVCADPAHLRRILAVLVHPAPLAPGLGEVVVAMRSDGGMVALDVAHPRWALPRTELGTLLEPFAPGGGPASRLDDARIRLALARALAVLNRGDLRLDGGEDAGVLFTLTIPGDAAP